MNIHFRACVESVRNQHARMISGSHTTGQLQHQ